MSKPISFLSWNVNGIRACVQKGFWDWFENSKADFICLQETKIAAKDFQTFCQTHNVAYANDTSLLASSSSTKPRTYAYLSAAEKPGYSGVAIFTHQKPLEVEVGLGVEKFDQEGRVIFLHFENFTLVNTYVPNAQPDLGRIPYKIEFSDLLLEKLEKLRKTQANIILCGDMNVAHQEIDIKRPKENRENSGFTQIERDWFTKFLSKGYIDTFRDQNPEAKDEYSWWSYRAGARKNNVGWRIDYFVVTEELKSKIQSVKIEQEQIGSDHCPVGLTLKI